MGNSRDTLQSFRQTPFCLVETDFTQKLRWRLARVFAEDVRKLPDIDTACQFLDCCIASNGKPHYFNGTLKEAVAYYIEFMFHSVEGAVRSKRWLNAKPVNAFS